MQITVFCGGPSSEHDVSLLSSQAILKALKHTRHTTKVIYITKSLSACIFSPQDELKLQIESLTTSDYEPFETCLEKNNDTIGIALLAGIHGEFAEDGQLQSILVDHQIPFTGSSAKASKLCIDKYTTCLAVEKLDGLKNPQMIRIENHSHSMPLEDNFPISFPVVLKPNSLGSSVGIYICSTYEDLCSRILKLHDEFPDETLLISEYISNGVEISCGCLQRMDGTFIELPPIEIQPQGRNFFDYSSKYETGGASEIVPPVSLPSHISMKVSRLACTIHEILGCNTYSRSDFIIKDSTVYFLETNTLPGFTATSLFPQETASIGMDLKDTLEFILNNTAH